MATDLVLQYLKKRGDFYRVVNTLSGPADDLWNLEVTDPQGGEVTFAERISKSVFTIQEAGIQADGTDQTLMLNLLMSSSNIDVVDFHIDKGGDVTINGTFNAQFKELNIKKGTKFTGTGTIQNAIFNAPLDCYIFGPDIELVNCTTATKFNSVAWWGAVGNDVADDTVPIQKAVTTICKNQSMYRELLFLKLRTYKITDTIRCEYFDTATSQYYFTSIVLAGGSEAANFFQPLNATIKAHFRDRPAINFQLCKGGGVRGLTVQGFYEQPTMYTDMTLAEFFVMPFADYQCKQGSRDSKYSPSVGISIDAYTTTGAVPPDGGYPGHTAFYTRSNQPSFTSGSSGITIKDCFVFQFTVGIGFTFNGGTQNCECMLVEDTSIQNCKVCISSGQDQEKTNVFRRLALWGQSHTLFTNKHYGASSPGNVCIHDINVAGFNQRIFDWLTGGYFPMHVDRIYGELFCSIGNIQGTNTVSLNDCLLDFVEIIQVPHNGYLQGVTLRGCTIRKYGTFAPCRFQGDDIVFSNCTFETEPITNTNGTVIFDNCRLKGMGPADTGSIGAHGTLHSQNVLYNPNTSVFGDFHIAHIGADYGDAFRYKVTYDNTVYHQEYPELGFFNISQVTATQTAVLTLNGASPDMFIVGKWLLNIDGIIGRIVSKNATTVNLDLCNFSAARVGARVYVYAPKRCNPIFTGDPQSGTNTITNCLYWQGIPTVGMCYTGINGLTSHTGSGWVQQNTFMITGVSGSTITISNQIAPGYGYPGTVFANGNPVFEIDYTTPYGDIGYDEGVFLPAGSLVRYNGLPQYKVVKSGVINAVQTINSAEFLYILGENKTQTVSTSQDPYIINQGDTVLVDASLGPVTLKIMNNYKFMTYRRIYIMRVDNTSNQILLDLDVGTINGAATFTLVKSAIFYFDKQFKVHAFDTSGGGATPTGTTLSVDGSIAIEGGIYLETTMLKPTVGMTINIGTGTVGEDATNIADQLVLTANATTPFPAMRSFDTAGTLYFTGITASGGTLNVKLFKKPY
jgi:hypothetical protein